MSDQNNKINNFDKMNNSSLNNNFSAEPQKLREVPKYLSNIFKYLKVLIFIEIIGVFLFAYFFIIKDKIYSINDKNKIIAERKEEINNLMNYESKSKELEKKYEQLKESKNEDIEKIKQVLPSESDLPGIMAQIEALVKENGLELGNINMSNSESSGSSADNRSSAVGNVSKKTDVSNMSDIKEVNVSIFVFGSNEGYDKIKSFLSALENHIRLIDVTSFTFDDKMSSYSINFKTYYLSNEK